MRLAELTPGASIILNVGTKMPKTLADLRRSHFPARVVRRTTKPTTVIAWWGWAEGKRLPHYTTIPAGAWLIEVSATYTPLYSSNGKAVPVTRETSIPGTHELTKGKPTRRLLTASALRRAQLASTVEAWEARLGAQELDRKLRQEAKWAAYHNARTEASRYNTALRATHQRLDPTQTKRLQSLGLVDPYGTTLQTAEDEPPVGAVKLTLTLPVFRAIAKKMRWTPTPATED